MMWTQTTLDDALELAAWTEYLDGAVYATLADLQDALEAQQEYRAEQEAESAWLRHAESQGWEEAYLESLLESGLISRY